MESAQKPFDLAVIGGGILGAFHAWHALERGLSVALFERNRRPRQATVRNFGQVVPSGMDAKWQAYGRRSLEIYRDLDRRFDLGLAQNGSIYLASDADEATLLGELSAINEGRGYVCELWTPDRCRQRYHNLRESYCTAGLFFPEELSVDPRRLIHRILEIMQQRDNFQLFAATPICSIEEPGDFCELHDLGGRSYRAERVMICNGAECELLYPELLSKGDLQRVKLQMLRLEAQSTLRMPGNILTGLSIRRYESFRECASYRRIHENEDRRAFWKQWGIHILFKQEADGTIILGDSHEYADLDSGQELDFRLRADIKRYFLEAGAQIFDLEHWRVADEWAGYYSQCRTRDLFTAEIGERIRLVTGIGGKGMTSSAALAEERIADWYN